jgi:hypothetical protein
VGAHQGPASLLTHNASTAESPDAAYGPPGLPQVKLNSPLADDARSASVLEYWSRAIASQILPSGCVHLCAQHTNVCVSAWYVYPCVRVASPDGLNRPSCSKHMGTSIYAYAGVDSACASRTSSSLLCWPARPRHCPSSRSVSFAVASHTASKKLGLIH